VDCLHSAHFSLRKVFDTSGEQSAVALVTNLRKVANRRCWVSNELEAILWSWCEWGFRRWGPHCYGNGGGGLDEIAAEVLPVAERPRLRYAFPLNAERPEESAHKSQSVSRVEAVRDTKSVEDRAKVLNMKNGLAVI
jgi:hypothetical protein